MLDKQPGVRESAVVGRDRVHAVLVLESGASAEEVVRGANAVLEEHQKVRDVSVWPGDALPRTEGTGKLKRREVQDWVASGAGPRAGKPEGGLESIVARYARNRAVGPGTTLEELGLSSLERVELMMAIEQNFGTSMDEGQFTAARTVSDLRAALDAPVASREPIVFPSWNRSGVLRSSCAVSLATWILPTIRLFVWASAKGASISMRSRGR